MSKKEYDTFYDHCDVCISRAVAQEQSEPLGRLDVMANARGREAVEAIFPGLSLVWGGESLPPEWGCVSIDLEKMIELCPGHKLKKIRSDPDKSTNVYAYRLGTTLMVGGIRVVFHSQEGWRVFTR
jgi:hypothetical protein